MGVTDVKRKESEENHQGDERRDIWEEILKNRFTDTKNDMMSAVS